MGVMEARTGRADRDAEDLGDVGQIPTLEMAKDEQDPLVGWQAAKASLELVPVDDREKVVDRGRDVHRKNTQIRDALPLTLGLGETRADDQAVEPGVESIRIAEVGQVAPGDDEGVLQGILGSIDVTQDPLGKDEETTEARLDQLGIRLAVPVPRRLDQIAIHPAPILVAPSGGVVRTLWGSGVGSYSIFAGFVRETPNSAPTTNAGVL